MPTVVLRLGGRPDKYGIVTVQHPDGSVQRQFRINEQALQALRSKGSGGPPGVTPAELTRGVWTEGKACDVGEMWVNDDGAILIKFADDENDGARIIESVLALHADDYTGVPPLITVDGARLAVIQSNADPRRVRYRSPHVVQSLVAGVLEYV